MTVKMHGAVIVLVVLLANQSRVCIHNDICGKGMCHGGNCDSTKYV